MRCGAIHLEKDEKNNIKKVCTQNAWAYQWKDERQHLRALEAFWTLVRILFPSSGCPRSIWSIWESDLREVEASWTNRRQTFFQDRSCTSKGVWVLLCWYSNLQMQCCRACSWYVQDKDVSPREVEQGLIFWAQKSKWKRANEFQPLFHPSLQLFLRLNSGRKCCK